MQCVGVPIRFCWEGSTIVKGSEAQVRLVELRVQEQVSSVFVQIPLIGKDRGHCFLPFQSAGKIATGLGESFDLFLLKVEQVFSLSVYVHVFLPAPDSTSGTYASIRRCEGMRLPDGLEEGNQYVLCMQSLLGDIFSVCLQKYDRDIPISSVSNPVLSMTAQLWHAERRHQGVEPPLLAKSGEAKRLSTAEHFVGHLDDAAVRSCWEKACIADRCLTSQRLRLVRLERLQEAGSIIDQEVINMQRMFALQEELKKRGILPYRPCSEEFHRAESLVEAEMDLAISALGAECCVS